MSSAQDRQAGASGSQVPGTGAQGSGTGQGSGMGQGPGTGQGPSTTGSGMPASGRTTGTGTETMTYERGQAPTRGYTGRHETSEHRGAVVGFTALAGTLMVLGGLWGVIVGIAALASGHYYIITPSGSYTYRWSVHGWGWAELILGIVVFAAGVCVFLGMTWARYVGAVLAVLSAIANFMFIPFTPLWSIIMIVLDAFIIWALLTPRRRPGQI
jgi:hypothetical protein